MPRKIRTGGGARGTASPDFINAAIFVRGTKAKNRHGAAPHGRDDIHEDLIIRSHVHGALIDYSCEMAALMAAKSRR